jgi:hypothetical protein
MEDKNNKLEEFKSAEALHRFEVSLMLGQMAVYLVVMGALFNGVINISENNSDFHVIGGALFGIFISLAFMIITHRGGLNQKRAVKRARELAEDLGFQLYSPEYRAPDKKVLTAKNTTRMVCVAGCVFWLVILVKALLY